MKKVFFTLITLAGIAFISASHAGQLEVGVATVDITPKQGVESVTGMSGKTAVVDKIHDNLYAKAIVFKNGEQSVAIITLELIVFRTEYLDRIRSEVSQKTGIKNVICAVTHTHGSGSPSGEVAERIISQAIDAAVAANATVEPAKIGYGQGVWNGGYNRRIIKEDGTVEMLWNNSDRVDTSPVDDEVGVVLIQRADDSSTLATLVNYAVHPVISMNFEELIISADYPGAMARKLEERLGGTCIYFMGASGDINPYDADMFRFATPEQVFASVDQLGEELATEVQKVASKISASLADVSLKFDAYSLDLARRENGPHGEKDVVVEVDTFLIDQQLAFVSLPGEMFVELGMDLKKRSPAEMTFVITCANQYLRYVPTIQAACEGGYGASSGTLLEVGAGELMIHKALVSLRHQMGQVKPLEPR
ncbi:neutral/alkaline non-lysosomal ceramidase N-terminal domain-containing protein [Pelagicoccus sp. SDUM812002]|uniref:neutral/alkaline non-lysosomal ceramidase N-terminal domain-containing protein n=1 Tax=Pelagicoccus sp. SDUM812002 TaxID=3041266 RepID=UPI00280EFF9F|nr:neutral/alkaline non-lysosomal ceramidase N-terminal domain-containing protein [Pelagicoccus sp. SDUM812002]MDQ8185269.1 neutral/alkaline non-lysosomal ceramidase N-terminal domain-containing protein [Pelagicoccus sp. SDUM812002]